MDDSAQAQRKAIILAAYRPTRGPRPLPPVKSSIRSLRRYRARCRRNNWTWAALGATLVADIHSRASRQGFIDRLYAKLTTEESHG